MNIISYVAGTVVSVLSCVYLFNYHSNRTRFSHSDLHVISEDRRQAELK